MKKGTGFTPTPMMALRKARMHSTPSLVSGFTLVELLIVLTIITVISGVVLLNQSSFNKTLVLTNTAYDVALTLRSAQVYGLGSRVTGTVTNAGYGVNFQKVNPNSFILFSDTYPSPSVLSECHPTSDASAPDAQPGDCAFQVDQNEKVNEYVLGNGIVISDFCAERQGNWSCAYAQGGELSSLDIIFARPNADPFITTDGTYSATLVLEEACILLSAPDGSSRVISVTESGQVTANSSSCP